MGVDYNTYLGPYIQVYSPSKDTTVKKQRCPNTACSNHKRDVNAPFCSKCGEKIRHIDVTIKAEIDFDIYNEFDERLFEAGANYGQIVKDHHIYVSNVRGGPGERCNAENSGIIPIDPVRVGTDLFRMKEQFAKEIARLQEVFGKDAVKVEWGLIQYAS